ncbi:hypothetical protein CSOJ01_11349 [Colletotrichum sojae]|uniref:Rhodopsin domain-containing protein n=1 Tax=Colletotrichum sojae TaxID=2175907 RepID=A0A8H6IXN2_9PEZI|nr:hypothetical protein CSOJ01_11349 [Colletotrichum sojae]
MIIAVCFAFTALGLLFVGGRLFICAILSNVLVTISVSWGNGRHFATLDLEQQQNTVKWMMTAYFPGIETLGFPKLAVIALLSRLLAPGRLHSWILWIMGTVCCLSLTAMVLTLLLQCTPPRALWTFSMPQNCLHPKTLEGLVFWASSFSAFLDFYLAVYPAVVLWKLQMPAKRKLALMCALGMGVVSGCVGIVKATAVPTLSSQDVSCEIEGNIIIIAACIPVLQPLLEILKGRSIWSTDKKSGSHPYEDHSKQSAGQPQDPIELRRTPRKKVDAYGFTIREQGDNEESIVKPDKSSETGSCPAYRKLPHRRRHCQEQHCRRHVR